LGALEGAAQEKNARRLMADGTAHITRVIRPSATVSPEAQKWLESLNHRGPGAKNLEERRKGTDEWRVRQSAVAKKLFPVNIREQIIGGVRTDVITPLETPAPNKNRVLINLHGGGFNSDSGSLIEGDPIRESGQDQSGVCVLPAGTGESVSGGGGMMWLRFTRNC